MIFNEILKSSKDKLNSGLEMSPLETAAYHYAYLRGLDSWKNLPPMIGWHKSIWMGGPEIVYTYPPIFGYRRIGLVNIRKDVDQVLVTGFTGELTWINPIDFCVIN